VKSRSGCAGVCADLTTPAEVYSRPEPKVTLTRGLFFFTTYTPELKYSRQKWADLKLTTPKM